MLGSKKVSGSRKDHILPTILLSILKSLGPRAVMGCIPCVGELRCGILGVKAVMGGILCVTAVFGIRAVIDFVLVQCQTFCGQ